MLFVLKIMNEIAHFLLFCVVYFANINQKILQNPSFILYVKMSNILFRNVYRSANYNFNFNFNLRRVFCNWMSELWSVSFYVAVATI